jgi:adenylosuccinate lyase
LGLIRDGVDALAEALKRRAMEHRKTVMVGRSHGIHGEPISFGFKLAVWYEEIARHRKRLQAVGEDIAVGKLSGAMGTFAHQGPDVEEFVCRKLGLTPDPVSNQVVQRDRHAAYVSALALLAATIEKMAVEIRHLQRTEVLEVEEYFSEGQKGSSAMPHKRNPIVSENLCGLARLVRANSLAAIEDVALWHERDISHSSVERVIMPDSTILVDYMLARVTDLITNLVVYPERMKRNLELTGGLVYSQRVLLALIEKGAQRKESYEAVQRNAMAAWKGGGTFSDLVGKDPFITRHLTAAEISSCFDPRYYLKHVDEIFRRVFSPSAIPTRRQIK